MHEHSIDELRGRHATPQKGKDAQINDADARAMLASMPGWQRVDDGEVIARTFEFPDYFHTMAFVNAVASIAHREDHHPDLEVGYARCRVRYSTHDVGGLSINDFICAAKVDDLVAPRSAGD